MPISDAISAASSAAKRPTMIVINGVEHLIPPEIECVSYDQVVKRANLKDGAAVTYFGKGCSGIVYPAQMILIEEGMDFIAIGEKA